jgi:hypothetical protein
MYNTAGVYKGHYIYRNTNIILGNRPEYGKKTDMYLKLQSTIKNKKVAKTLRSAILKLKIS